MGPLKPEETILSRPAGQQDNSPNPWEESLEEVRGKPTKHLTADCADNTDVERIDVADHAPRIGQANGVTGSSATGAGHQTRISGAALENAGTVALAFCRPELIPASGVTLNS